MKRSLSGKCNVSRVVSESCWLNWRRCVFCCSWFLLWACWTTRWTPSPQSLSEPPPTKSSVPCLWSGWAHFLRTTAGRSDGNPSLLRSNQSQSLDVQLLCTVCLFHECSLKINSLNILSFRMIFISETFEVYFTVLILMTVWSQSHHSTLHGLESEWCHEGKLSFPNSSQTCTQRCWEAWEKITWLGNLFDLSGFLCFLFSGLLRAVAWSLEPRVESSLCGTDSPSTLRPFYR